MACISSPEEDFVSGAEAAGPAPLLDFTDPATEDCTHEYRAAGVRRVIEAARAHDLSAAGSFATGVSEIVAVNSLGVHTRQRSGSANLDTVVSSPDSAGHAWHAAAAVNDIDPDAVGARAVNKALASRHPGELEPGRHTVILEEAAVGDMVMMLGLYGLGALALQEGRSFMCGKLGERICGENVHIWDDGLDPRGRQMAYDFEGVPKQQVDLIRNGVAEGVVWDTYTANREGRASTGHALPAPATWGPMPIHLFVGTGDSSVEEMIASTERGVLVTRFHYTNMVHPVKAILTGMTRDGTFLIEDGKITGGLKNLRFTQGVLEALSCVSAIGREGRLLEYSWAPAMKIDCFTFSSGTDF